MAVAIVADESRLPIAVPERRASKEDYYSSAEDGDTSSAYSDFQSSRESLQSTYNSPDVDDQRRTVKIVEPSDYVNSQSSRAFHASNGSLSDDSALGLTDSTESLNSNRGRVWLTSVKKCSSGGENKPGFMGQVHISRALTSVVFENECPPSPGKYGPENKPNSQKAVRPDSLPLTNVPNVDSQGKNSFPRIYVPKHIRKKLKTSKSTPSVGMKPPQLSLEISVSRAGEFPNSPHPKKRNPELARNKSSSLNDLTSFKFSNTQRKGSKMYPTLRGIKEEQETGSDHKSTDRSLSTSSLPGVYDHRPENTWVGVHGGQKNQAGPSNGPVEGSALLLDAPPTPHIVVSSDVEDETPIDLLQEQEPRQEDMRQYDADTPKAPSAPTSPTEGTKRLPSFNRPESLNLNLNYLNPMQSFSKKTRRNSMLVLLRRFNSNTNLAAPIEPIQHSLSVPNIRRASSRNSLAPSETDDHKEAYDSLIACVSALYGKLLVVFGMAFPVAEVLSSEVPVSFYNGFYLYLYTGSIVFLMYVYIFLLRTKSLPKAHIKSKFQSLKSLIDEKLPSLPTPQVVRKMASRTDIDKTSNSHRELNKKPIQSDSLHPPDDKEDRLSIATSNLKAPKYTITESNNHGSMYLKMGAVLFGIGSMIYSGLEVGQYFELKSGPLCNNILLAITPAGRMLFTFIQMYFIFLNSRVAISKHRVIARFGLMHMVGTNLCIWLNVLVQETKHEIIHLKDSHAGDAQHGSTNRLKNYSSVLGDHDGHSLVNTTLLDIASSLGQSHTLAHSTPASPFSAVVNETHHIVKRGTVQNRFSVHECRRSNLMGDLVDSSSPFLFPCTIEYSLLCAGVLYVMWKNINKPYVHTYDADSDISTFIARKARHHYSVDCAHANRGLFMGILMLVLTIISLILFFVLINNEEYKEIAILEANIIELSVYSVAIITVIIGMIQMRELEFIPEGDIELDNILLLIAQTGVYIYTSFTIIGGYFTMQGDFKDNLVLPLITAFVTLTQTTLQTLFILDASRRCCYTQRQLDKKPGREMVTFLLVCNLAMWAISTFETSRADAHPTQLNFYGIWAWTIISHVSMPLAIFYRFHVTVCLCEIWKRSYKMKQELM